MNLLTRSQHSYVDLITVVVFLVAPLLLDFSTGAAILAYVLGGVQLIMTGVTEGLPLSVGRLVPLPLHGLIEAVVGVVLGLIGWLVFDGDAGAFYLAMAAVILLVFAITPYLDQAS